MKAKWATEKNVYSSCKCMIHGIKRSEYEKFRISKAIVAIHNRWLSFDCIAHGDWRSRNAIFLSIQSVFNSSVSLFAVELGVHYIRAICTFIISMFVWVFFLQKKNFFLLFRFRRIDRRWLGAFCDLKKFTILFYKVERKETRKKIKKRIEYECEQSVCDRLKGRASMFIFTSLCCYRI